MTIVITNGTVIAWRDNRHQVLEQGVVAFEGNEILYVGDKYEGPVDQEVDATGRIVMPGFINSHLHLTDTPLTKGYLEDNVGPVPRDKNEYSANLYRTLPAVRNAIDPDAQVAAAECAIAELLRCGSTTIVEMAYDYEIMGGGDITPVERVALAIGNAGLRGYTAPRYRTMYYREQNDGSILYSKNPNDGLDRFHLCVRFCEEWNGSFDDRLRTMLAPGQVDTCDPDLLKETRRAANRLRIPIQIHAGQSAQEFRTVREARDRTVVEYLEDTGLLGDDLIIGHGQFLSESGDVADMLPHEIDALRASQTSIAHLPWVKARRGGVINSIYKYKQNGIRQCMGTDTFPYDMFFEMRMSATMCKVVERSASVAFAPEIFAMATTGGADALGRPDLGRLAPGCKADVVLVRTDTPKAAPAYDPFKFLVYTASGDDVDKVMIDGRLVVDDGEVLTMDVPAVVERINAVAARVRDRVVQ